MPMKDDDALCLILDLRVDIVIVSQFLVSSSSSRPTIHQLSLQVFNGFLKTQALDIHSFAF
jgi:hypothetical protein